MEQKQDAIPIEQSLSFTQDIRRALIKKIVGTGADLSLPEDKVTAGLLPKLLDGMDKISLTQMKIKSEEKRDNEGAKAIVAAFLSSVNANDLNTKRTESVSAVDLEMPDEVAKTHDMVTDERQMAMGTQNDNVEAFNERLGLE